MLNKFTNGGSSIPILCQDTLAAGTKKTYEYTLTGSGNVSKMHVTFATGENGTLHITPYIIWNNGFVYKLLQSMAGTNGYIAGDNESFDFNCYAPTENGARLVVEADNTGAAASMVDVAFIVNYDGQTIEPSIIG